MASKPTPALTLTHARFGHTPHTVIQDADAQVYPGQNVLIVGANGAGKSTLLATLAGLLPVISGHVQVLGLDPLAQRRRLHETTGYLGHKSGFYPELTGRENLMLHAGLRGLDQKEVQQQLDSAGLLPAADQAFSEYSHGMGRRLGFAKALLGAPRLLLLDEPDAGLDRNAHDHLRARLSARPERTVLMATHNPLAHLEWADQAWVLGSKRLLVLTQEDGLDKTRLDEMQQEVRP